MKNKVLLIFIIAIFSGLCISLQAQEIDRIHRRNGLRNFYKKVSQNDTVRIAYFGGSITAASGWRVKSFNWLKEEFPKCHFVEINATLGGTGSDLGAFRLANDVIKHKPDLVFVEFAVNDYSTPKINIEKQYEGIVRQIWKENPSADICFIYSIMEVMMEKYNKGGVSESVEAAEAIANYYAIPSVNFAYEVLEQINQKQLIIKGPENNEGKVRSFSRDGVHPYINTGHEIYFGEFRKFFNKLSKMKIKENIHKVGKPQYRDNWENAKILDYEELSFSGSWEIVSGKNSIFKTNTSGASVSFTFNGTMLGIKDVIGPRGCKVDIFIDDKKYTKLRFDKYCTYDRTNYVFIPNLEEGNHKVQIMLSTPLSVQEKIEILKARTPDAKSFPEKMSENNFSLIEIMILSNS